MVYSRHLRFLINAFSMILFSLSVVYASGQTATPDRCTTIANNLNTVFGELGEICSAISDSGIEGCGDVESTCRELRFDRDECLSANDFNQDTCADIVRVDGERPRLGELGSQCSNLASTQMAGRREENRELREDLRSLRADRAEAAGNGTNMAQALADMAQQNAEAEQQAAEQRADAMDREIEEMGRADETRRDTIREAKAEIRAQEDSALQQRAEYRMASVQISEKLAELHIACLDLEANLRTQTDQLEAERIAARANKAQCIGPRISCVIQDEGVTEQDIMAARDDCMYGEKSDRVQQQIEAEGNAITMNTEEALALANSRMLEAQSEKEMAEATYVMAIRQIQENRIRELAEIDRSLAAQRQQNMNGALMGVAGALAGGGGATGDPNAAAAAGQDPNTAAINNDIARMEEEETLNQCVISCGTILGGEDRGEANATDDGGHPVARARSKVEEIRAMCGGGACSDVCSGYMSRIETFSGTPARAPSGEDPDIETRNVN